MFFYFYIYIRVILLNIKERKIFNYYLIHTLLILLLLSLLIFIIFCYCLYSLPSMSDIERRRQILYYTTSTRKQFLKLMTLVKWAENADNIQMCQV